MRVKPSLVEQLKLLADQNATSIPVEVNRLVREGLQRDGFWPPPPVK